MRKELRYDVTRVLGARNTQKLSKLMIPGCYTYARQCSPSNLPPPSPAQNCFHPTHIFLLPPPPPNSEFYCVLYYFKTNSHSIYRRTPTLFFFSASSVHYNLNIHHDTVKKDGSSSSPCWCRWTSKSLSPREHFK
jgi:hypothetical protein